MSYLLDTNIVSDLVRRQHTSPVRRRIQQVGQSAVCTSIIVAGELRYGVSKGGSAELRRRVPEILQSLTVLPIEEPVDTVYAELRARLEGAGQRLDGNDLLIAAQALALGHTLVTADRGFDRIAELPCENWLQ